MRLFGFPIGDNTKAAPVRDPSEAPKNPRAVVYKNTRPVLIYDCISTAEQAIRHPVVQRVLRMITRAVQVVDWYCEADDSGTFVSKPTIAAMNDLLRSPNQEMSAANLRYWMAMTQAIYSRTPIKVGLGALGNPNAIYPLDAKFLNVDVDKYGQISRYLYGAPNTKAVQIFGTRTLRKADGYAYQISSPGLSADPVATHDRLVPLTSLGGPMKVIEALLLRTLATAQGHPNSKYVITTESSLTQTQVDDIEDYIQDHQTFGERSGEVMWVQGTKLEVHKLDSNLSDIHSKVPMDDMSRMIFGAFGVPIALAGLGAADSAKYAGNFAEGRSSFYNDTIIPEYLAPLADGLTMALCPPGAVIKFDLDTIPSLLLGRIEAASKLKEVSFLTDDEKRELIGFKKLTPEQKTALLPPPSNSPNQEDDPDA